MGKSATERSRDLRAKRRAAGVPIKTTNRISIPVGKVQAELSPLETRVARLEALMSAQERRLVALEDGVVAGAAGSHPDKADSSSAPRHPNLQGVAMNPAMQNVVERHSQARLAGSDPAAMQRILPLPTFGQIGKTRPPTPQVVDDDPGDCA